MKISERLQKLRHKLAERGVDAILISQPENRRYLSGFNGSTGYLLITGQDAILATDFRYVEQAEKQAPDYYISQINSSMDNWLPKLVETSGLKRLGFEAGCTSFAEYSQLSDAMDNTQFQTGLVPIDGIVESIRVVKEAEEIALITKAAGISDHAFEHIQDIIHPGMTEKEVVWEIEKTMRESGSEPMPFD
ncbi:aminopeptidase P family protein, partial [Chloroflexota bacterium]